jgi:hypothetical protein
VQPKIPPDQAKVTLITAPGTEFQGQSVAMTFNPDQPLRIPSIYDPERVGRRFILQEPASSPGTNTFFLKNITLHIEKGTFETLSQSPSIREFLDVSIPGTRFCIGNRCESAWVHVFAEHIPGSGLSIYLVQGL